MHYEVNGKRPRGGIEKTWYDIVENDMRTSELKRSNAMDRKSGE